MTKPYAEVIGDPIAQSKSPLIHSFWIAKFGLTADYKARHVLSGSLATYLDQRRTEPDWRGCNVTMPHKQTILPLLDHLDPLASRVGAVNTVVRNQDGSLTGFNTDVAGFLEPLVSDLQNDHLFRMARILGTGGAARAIVAALADRGFVLVIAGRDPAKAERLLEELAPGGENFTPPLSHFAKATDFAFDDREGCYDLVVNASPLGMTGQPDLPFDVSHAPPGSIVYDIVTSPVQTPLLREARARGFGTIDGLSMLIGQAREAFRLFFHQTAPCDWDDELRELLLA